MAADDLNVKVRFTVDTSGFKEEVEDAIKKIKVSRGIPIKISQEGSVPPTERQVKVQASKDEKKKEFIDGYEIGKGMADALPALKDNASSKELTQRLSELQVMLKEVGFEKGYAQGTGEPTAGYRGKELGIRERMAEISADIRSTRAQENLTAAQKENIGILGKFGATNKALNKAFTSILIDLHMIRVLGQHSRIVAASFEMIAKSIGFVIDMALLPLLPAVITVSMYFIRLGMWINNLNVIWKGLIAGALGITAGFLTFITAMGTLLKFYETYKIVVGSLTVSKEAETIATNGATASVSRFGLVLKGGLIPTIVALVPLFAALAAVLAIFAASKTLDSMEKFVKPEKKEQYETYRTLMETLPGGVGRIFSGSRGKSKNPWSVYGRLFGQIIGDERLMGLASGGPLRLGQSAVVGEAGPELLVPASGGFNVIPNRGLRFLAEGTEGGVLGTLKDSISALGNWLGDGLGKVVGSVFKSSIGGMGVQTGVGTTLGDSERAIMSKGFGNLSEISYSGHKNANVLLAAILAALMRGFGALVGGAVGVAEDVLDKVWDAAGKAWDAIMGVLRAAWDVIVAAWHAAWAILHAIWNTMWDTAKRIWDTMWNIAGLAWDVIVAGWHAAWNILSDLWDAMWVNAGEAWDTIMGKVSDAFDGITETITKIKIKVQDLIDWIITTIPIKVQDLIDWIVAKISIKAQDLVDWVTNKIPIVVQGLVDWVTAKVSIKVQELVDWITAKISIPLQGLVDWVKTTVPIQLQSMIDWVKERITVKSTELWSLEKVVDVVKSTALWQFEKVIDTIQSTDLWTLTKTPKSTDSTELWTLNKVMDIVQSTSLWALTKVVDTILPNQLWNLDKSVKENVLTSEIWTRVGEPLSVAITDLISVRHIEPEEYDWPTDYFNWDPLILKLKDLWAAQKWESILSLPMAMALTWEQMFVLPLAKLITSDNLFTIKQTDKNGFDFFNLGKVEMALSDFVTIKAFQVAYDTFFNILPVEKPATELIVPKTVDVLASALFTVLGVGLAAPLFYTVKPIELVASAFFGIIPVGVNANLLYNIQQIPKFITDFINISPIPKVISDFITITPTQKVITDFITLSVTQVSKLATEFFSIINIPKAVSDFFSWSPIKAVGTDNTSLFTWSGVSKAIFGVAGAGALLTLAYHTLTGAAGTGALITIPQAGQLLVGAMGSGALIVAKTLNLLSTSSGSGDGVINWISKKLWDFTGGDGIILGKQYSLFGASATSIIDTSNIDTTNLGISNSFKSNMESKFPGIGSTLANSLSTEFNKIDWKVMTSGFGASLNAGYTTPTTPPVTNPVTTPPPSPYTEYTTGFVGSWNASGPAGSLTGGGSASTIYTSSANPGKYYTKSASGQYTEVYKSASSGYSNNYGYSTAPPPSSVPNPTGSGSGLASNQPTDSTNGFNGTMAQWLALSGTARSAIQNSGNIYTIDGKQYKSGSLYTPPSGTGTGYVPPTGPTSTYPVGALVWDGNYKAIRFSPYDEVGAGYESVLSRAEWIDYANNGIKLYGGIAEYHPGNNTGLVIGVGEWLVAWNKAAQHISWNAEAYKSIYGVYPPEFPAMATGGTVLSAGLALVGERGPELLNLPTGAKVAPPDKSFLKGFTTEPKVVDKSITYDFSGSTFQVTGRTDQELFDNMMRLMERESRRAR